MHIQLHSFKGSVLQLLIEKKKTETKTSGTDSRHILLHNRYKFGSVQTEK